MTYEEAQVYISSLQKRGWRLGLDRMQELLRLCGNPELTAQCFHVAGTNGKGSVAKYIQSALTANGYRTGSFYSPYVYDFRERIQVDAEMISPDDVARLTAFLHPFSESLVDTEFGGPTEFEFKTAMGFLHWQEQHCDFISLETGLGGRLDATNVCKPTTTIITEIALDHQEHLGETITEIAGEKAGIIKHRVPCICGTQNPDAANAISIVADVQEAPLWRLGREIRLEADSISTPARTHKMPKPGMRGAHQKTNAAIAIAALDISGVPMNEDALQLAITNAALPGRFEVIRNKLTIILDGAHNQHAAQALASAVSSEFPGSFVRVVFSSATGHDAAGPLVELAKIAGAIYIAQMEHPRAQPFERLREDAEGALLGGAWSAHESVSRAVAAAISDSAPDDVVLITGSFYLLAEAKAALRPVLGAAR